MAGSNLLISKVRLLYHTLSNACHSSRTTAGLFFVKSLFEYRCYTVDLINSRMLDSEPKSKVKTSISGLRRFSRSFSNSLSIVGKGDVSLHEMTSSPNLGLNKYVDLIMKLSINSLKNPGHI